MVEEESKRRASAWLRANAFEVESIPTVDGEKRADLSATWGTEKYAVEAKAKGESPFWRRLVSEAKVRTVAMGSAQVEPSNTVARVIEEAADQLAATPLDPEAFRVAWFSADHFDGISVLDDFGKRLFGLVSLTCLFLDERGGPTNVMPVFKDCYFYDPSDFARYPDLDAAVLTTGETLVLCVNTFSPRTDSFRRSHLHHVVGAHGAVLDPEIEERAGRALWVEPHVPVGGEHAFLKEKYRVGTSRALEGRWAGLLRVDPSRLS